VTTGVTSMFTLHVGDANATTNISLENILNPTSEIDKKSIETSSESITFDIFSFLSGIFCDPLVSRGFALLSLTLC
jgi:hypothetical protein